MRQQTGHHVKAALCVLAGALLAVACSPTVQVTPPIPQATPAGLPWGAPKSLGMAESLSAPSVAFSVSSGTTMFAWAGADQQESRLYAQSAEASAPTILALKATSPLDVTLAPSGAGFFHLLWRDDVEGKPHLFYSIFNDKAVAELEAYDVSEQPIYNFAILPRKDGSLRVIYSAGWVAEPRLFVHEIDANGRSQFPVALDQAGDFPVVLPTWNVNVMWLFWQMEDGTVWQGQLEGTTLIDAHSAVMAPALASGDALTHLSVTEDNSYNYLFWQIVRADGTPETWYAVGETNGSRTWSPAMRLTIPTLGDTPVQTGYRVGQVTAAERGADPVGWSGPLTALSTGGIVPIAVQTGDILGIAYLNRGNIIGYQRLATVGKLVDPPVLITHPDDSLVVSWAEIGADAAQLYWLQSAP